MDDAEGDVYRNDRFESRSNWSETNQPVCIGNLPDSSAPRVGAHHCHAYDVPRRSPSDPPSVSVGSKHVLKSGEASAFLRIQRTYRWSDNQMVFPRHIPRAKLINKHEQNMWACCSAARCAI